MINSTDNFDNTKRREETAKARAVVMDLDTIKELRRVEAENAELKNTIAALKESNEKLVYDNFKTEFFTNISHEFKTPLNVLMGALQLLELYSSNGVIIDPQLKLDKYMKTMKQNAHRLLRLINNLIDLTKIDSSYFEGDFHNYDIVGITEGIIQSISIYARVKNIKLTFVKEVERKIISCDLDKIERVLLNLLSNAVKFTDENGYIEVRIVCKKDKLFICVKDNGIGIPEDKLQVIFQRFRQVDKSFTRNREGSGIGLSLVKAIVEMHGGEIYVESEYGKGSSFTVVLPVVTTCETLEDFDYLLYEDMRKEKVKVEFSDITMV